MTTILEVVTQAFRESNLIAIGQTPTATEQGEALPLLNSVVKSLLQFEAGGFDVTRNLGSTGVSLPNLDDNLPPTATTYLEENLRLYCNITAATTVTLPPTPSNGAQLQITDVAGTFATYPLTVLGNGRNIQGSSSVILNVSSSTTSWFYRADLANWNKVSNLALVDLFPFPDEFVDLVSVAVALRLNPRNGAAVDEQTLVSFKRLRGLFRSQYNHSKTADLDSGLIRLTTGSSTGRGLIW